MLSEASARKGANQSFGAIESTDDSAASSMLLRPPFKDRSININPLSITRALSLFRLPSHKHAGAIDRYIYNVLVHTCICAIQHKRMPTKINHKSTWTTLRKWLANDLLVKPLTILDVSQITHTSTKAKIHCVISDIPEEMKDSNFFDGKLWDNNKSIQVYGYDPDVKRRLFTAQTQQNRMVLLSACSVKESRNGTDYLPPPFNIHHLIILLALISIILIIIRQYLINHSLCF